MMRGRGRGRGSFPLSDGDWTCSECGNVNFARRHECNRCREPKKPGIKRVKQGGVHIGKAAAEKSRGLFSADDWICKTCGNVNWARRSDCNLCNTPKIGVQEERTGLGGGFNEREGVEYKERRGEDSDDEYDQYGRKKRRKSQSVGREGKNSRQQEEKGKENEDEDLSEEGDDDDDEDGDLSKYDLDGDEDDDEGDASKYDLGASDEDGNKDSKSPTRKRRYSSSSDRSSGSPRPKRDRSRSRSDSSSSEERGRD